MWSQNSFFLYANFNFSSASPYSTTSSPPFPPSFPLFFPNFFHRNSLGNLSERLLKFQKNLLEEPSRKYFLPPLLPERVKEKIPKNPLFLGFLKGSGEEDKKRNPEKTEMPSMAGNGFEGRGKKRALRGGRHPQGPDYYSFFCCPAGKIKICGEENLVLQEHPNSYSINLQSPPAPQPIWQ